jgi:protein-disulfide isomerase
MMRKGTLFFVVAAVAVVGGYFGGRTLRHNTPDDGSRPTAVAPAPAPAPTPGQPAPAAPRPAMISSEVYRVEVGQAPVTGAKQPKVTLIEFSDFECPYCSRMTDTVHKLLKDFPNELAVSFKHFPLPMHPNAVPAALAAEAAREQGKFWEMHDKLFANQRALGRPELEKYAQELGLDLTRFKASLDQQTTKQVIEAQQKEGQTFGVRGTPSSFVNGRFMRGAQPYEAFKGVIQEEIKKADAKIASGVGRGELYAAFIKGGLEKAAAPPPPPAAAGRTGEPAAGVAYRVEVGKAPVKGPKDALVTIVQFSDFQCPFCSRVEPTMAQVMDAYQGKVRVAWKDNPLPFHQNAMPAAIAARAAGEQGKFWEMHGKLFANQQNLDRATFEKLAGELKLDLPRFKAALDAEKHKADIQADTAQAAKMGAAGTPAFFINGVFLSGAQPFDNFKSRIDEEIKKADALVAKGIPKAKLYDTIMKAAKTEVSAAPAQAQAEPPGPEQDTKVWKVEPGDAPSRGPKNAPVTLVLFSDFQCPFCKRVEPTITQLEKEYPGKIRVVWKNMPLEFHQHAKPAAAAALAAGEQGKFWEMHAKLFENQTALDRPNLEKYAQELGLDVAKFKAAMDSDKLGAKIQSDMKEAAAVEVNGTPATFVNGRKIGGAYPYDTFKKLVDQELAKGGRVAADRRRRG